MVLFPPIGLQVLNGNVSVSSDTLDMLSESDCHLVEFYSIDNVSAEIPDSNLSLINSGGKEYRILMPVKEIKALIKENYIDRIQWEHNQQLP